jgi:hypothetical protein
VTSELGRIRRGLIVGIATACAIASITVALVGVTSASAGPSIDNFVVFGQNGVHVGFDTEITGLVGAQHDRTENPNPHEALRMQGGSLIKGDALIGQNVTLENSTHIAGTLTYPGPPAGNAVLTLPLKAKIDAITTAVPSLPAIPSYWPAGKNCGTANRRPTIDGTANGKAKANARITLAPGAYGTISGGAGATLEFAASGDYFIKDVDMANVKLEYDALPVHIFVCHKFQTAHVLDIKPASLKSSDVYVEVRGDAPFPTDANAFEISGGTWIGDVVVPTSGIHAGSGGGQMSMTGHFWADHVDFEHHVLVRAASSFVPPTPPTTAPGTTIRL